MSLSLERYHALDVFHPEVVGCGLVLGCELFDHRSLGERHVVLVSRQNLVGVLLCRPLYHGEEARLHLFAVDDECPSEYLMAAMLRVYLRESEYLRVGQRSAELLFNLVEILHLLR